MTFTNAREEAVSEVVATILLVMVTVVLAAVIAASVLGLVSHLQKTKVVAATAHRTSDSNVTVIYYGGQDAGSLDVIQWTVDSAYASDSGNTLNATGYMQNGGTGSATNPTSVPLNTGTQAQITNAGNPGHNHILATGVFSDGTLQVILDITV
jgi:flagellin-like protein